MGLSQNQYEDKWTAKEVHCQSGNRLQSPGPGGTAVSRRWSGDLAECSYRELSWLTSPEGRWGQHSWAVGRGLSHTSVKVCL